MASLFAKCSLEITGNPNDLEEEDYKMYEEKKKLFYQPNDFKTYPPNDLCFMIRYCGTMDIGKGRTSHTFTGEKLDITPEEMEAFKKTI
jgi:hypothetical protein